MKTKPLRPAVLMTLGDVSAIERGEPDVVLLDLSDSLPTADSVERAKSILAVLPVERLWIGVGALADHRLEPLIAAIAPLRPAAFVLSAATSAADVQHLGAMLAVQEAETGLPDGSSRIVARIESAPALFELHRIAKASGRLDALMWDGEAFARDLDAEEARGSDGRWTDPLQTVRTLLLAACADAGLPAIDSTFSGASAAAFQGEAEAARRDGFAAKIALDAGQAAIVRSAFAARR